MKVEYEGVDIACTCYPDQFQETQLSYDRQYLKQWSNQSFDDDTREGAARYN